MTKRTLITVAVLIGLSCGTGTGPDQTLFTLSGGWRGQLLSIGGQFSFGELQLTLEGERDGAVEEYRGEGTLFGTQFVRRFQQLSADFDTAADSLLDMTIIDFPGTGAVFTGKLNGAILTLRDTVFCQCEVDLSR